VPRRGRRPAAAGASASKAASRRRDDDTLLRVVDAGCGPKLLLGNFFLDEVGRGPSIW
jgi:hypothetical protein